LEYIAKMTCQGCCQLPLHFLFIVFQSHASLQLTSKTQFFPFCSKSDISSLSGTLEDADRIKGVLIEVFGFRDRKSS
jgi:hypothetical protein